ncbi:Rhodanese-like protein [Choiromyces venosus 120613-1]|uniref:Rhodanese-like protein n=1 Tax=Choiromyces venosus 120613-1 TaxID=1336337 RepID=A0A3N4JKW8_9PEZI|nr:Rhodanese-like protein [Choiromyces venosus 120613-1]
MSMALTKISFGLIRTLKSKSTLFNSKFSMATASRAFSSYIIEPTELAKALEANPPLPGLGTPRVIPISAEWYLPNDARKGPEEFAKLRIPTARFFDLDAVKDHDSPFPHMVPTGKTFAEAMSEMGVGREDTVVLYDSPQIGIFSAPRAAWTFRVFGHPRVHLLNNFKIWVEQGFPVEEGPAGQVVGTEYPVTEPDLSLISSFEEILDIAKEGGREGVQILDARPQGRFSGSDPEPRPGLSSGHVPGSISVPFSELVDPVTKKLRSGEELREILLRKGVDPSAKVEKKLMCGTGVTAVVIESALQLAGFEGKKKIYDGSWTEWAQRIDEKSGLISKK